MHNIPGQPRVVCSRVLEVVQEEIMAQESLSVGRRATLIMPCNWLGPLCSAGCFVTHYVFPHKFSGHSRAW